MRALACALLALLLAACSYDWTLGPADAGPSAQGDAPAAEGGDGAFVGDANGECTGLSNMLAIERGTTILHCQSSCYDTVKDECGCDVAVENMASSAVQTYVANVNQYKAAGCRTSMCPSSCRCPAHLCISTVCT